MLIYSPAFDISHCVFRFFYILNILENNIPYEIEKILIIDFYLAYPGCFCEFKFPLAIKNIKNEFKDIKKDYRDPIISSQTFRKVSILQRKALASILSQGYLDIESYKNGYIKKNRKDFPLDLINNLLNFSFYGNKKLPLILIISLLDIDLNGDNGLKARSGLMEYRYENT